MELIIFFAVLVALNLTSLRWAFNSNNGIDNLEWELCLLTSWPRRQSSQIVMVPTGLDYINGVSISGIPSRSAMIE